MGWDFSTEPEFQKKLDWVDEFCREQIEPLEYVFPYAVRSREPKIRELVKGLQDKVKEQGLWALFLDGNFEDLRHTWVRERGEPFGVDDPDAL